jgi:hypothetical protein
MYAASRSYAGQEERRKKQMRLKMSLQMGLHWRFQSRSLDQAIDWPPPPALRCFLLALREATAEEES